MKPVFFFTIISIGLLLAAGRARADENDDLLQQVITTASKNVDSSKAAEVQVAVDNNQDVIKAIVQSYRAYLDQVQALSDGDDANSGGTKAAKQNTKITLQNTVPSVTKAGTTSSPLKLEIKGLETSGKLQGSGKLEDAHLDGYPSLPDVEPTSSILNPTAVQLEHGREVDETVRSQKLFHLKNPTRYEH